MLTLSPVVLFMVLGSIVAQVLGVSLLPRTQGLTHPLFTLACGLSFATGLGLMARIAHAGVSLGILVPFMAATIPLAAIGVGIVVYGESASPLKLGLLVGACVTIGVASSLR